MSEPTHSYDGPVHGWFGLTYANYLVLNRALLQAMPTEWQERFVACLEELHEAVREADIEVASEYRVNTVSHGKFIKDPVPHYRRANLPNIG